MSSPKNFSYDQSQYVIRHLGPNGFNGRLPEFMVAPASRRIMLASLEKAMDVTAAAFVHMIRLHDKVEAPMHWQAPCRSQKRRLIRHSVPGGTVPVTGFMRPDLDSLPFFTEQVPGMYLTKEAMSLLRTPVGFHMFQSAAVCAAVVDWLETLYQADLGFSIHGRNLSVVELK